MFYLKFSATCEEAITLYIVMSQAECTLYWQCTECIGFVCIVSVVWVLSYTGRWRVAGEVGGCFRLGLPSLPLCLPGNEALSLFTRILSRRAHKLCNSCWSCAFMWATVYVRVAVCNNVEVSVFDHVCIFLSTSITTHVSRCVNALCSCAF